MSILLHEREDWFAWRPVRNVTGGWICWEWCVRYRMVVWDWYEPWRYCKVNGT